MVTAQTMMEFSCPLKVLWDTVTNLEHTTWRSDLARVEVLGEGCFAEHTRSGYVTRFTVTACDTLHFWAFTMENSNMSGTWEGHFEEIANGSRLVCTEMVKAKHWWMHPFVPGYLKRQQKRYLDDLYRALLDK